MASFRIDDILARPHGSRSETSSGLGVSTPVPSYQQLSFGVDQILGRHETEQRERLPLLGKMQRNVNSNTNLTTWPRITCPHVRTLMSIVLMLLFISRLLIFTGLCGRY